MRHRSDPGIGIENVEPTERFDRVRHQCGNIGLIGGIALVRGDVRIARRRFVHAVSAVGGNHRGARFGKQPRGRPPDARARAGNDRDFARKVDANAHIVLPPSTTIVCPLT